MKKYYDDKIIDNEILKAINDNDKIPSYVDKSMKDAVQKIRTNNDNNLFSKLKKIIFIIFSLVIATTSIVFAKDIAEFFKSIFTNSTPGIDSAIENGEVYNIDMDFVYSNDIGIKITNVVEDKNVIDIALVFDCPKENNITNIVFSEFEIFDEKNNIADTYSYNGIKYVGLNNYFTESIVMMNDLKVIDNLYYKSILFNVKDKLDIENLKLKISQIQIYKNKEIYTINGEWNFTLNLSNNFEEKIVEPNYNIKYDKNILKSISYEVNNTNFIATIDFLEEFNLDIISDIENIIVKNKFGEEIDIESIIYDKECNNLNIEMNFGKFNLPDYLELYIKYDNEKDTVIKIYK